MRLDKIHLCRKDDKSYPYTVCGQSGMSLIKTADLEKTNCARCKLTWTTRLRDNQKQTERELYNREPQKGNGIK